MDVLDSRAEEERRSSNSSRVTARQQILNRFWTGELRGKDKGEVRGRRYLRR